MSRASVEVDREIAPQAADILGAKTLRDTVGASLREVANAKRRIELIALLADADRFDLSRAVEAWDGD